jgi:hypothetical protein
VKQAQGKFNSADASVLLQPTQAWAIIIALLIDYHFEIVFQALFGGGLAKTALLA